MSVAEFAGQVVVVTGGASGIGAAVVRGFAAGGAEVVAVDRAEALGRGDRPGRAEAADVTDPAAVERALGAAARQTGAIDHLVICAGITRDAVLWKLTDDAWSDVLAVNLTGAFYALRAATPWLRGPRTENGRAARSVVLVASINGERGKFGQANYAASKAGMIGLAKCAARELGRFDIRVNVVSPGLVDTPLTAALPADVRAAALAETALGRAATPDDVAGPIMFLCSERARHVTGQVLRVDGGQLM